MSAHTPGPWEWDGDVWEVRQRNRSALADEREIRMPVFQGDID
jgi:hypothetical protein